MQVYETKILGQIVICLILLKPFNNSYEHKKLL